MRIVALDGRTLDPGDNPWDGLAALGDLIVHERTDGREIVSRAEGAEILVVNKAPLSAETLSRLPDLRFVAVTATGYDVVDVAAARARGVAVSNVPEYSTDSVAQHTIALLLELAQHVGEHDAAVRAGEWQRSPDFCFWHRTPIELAGLAFGIVGFGRIGRRVGEIAHALGMRILASTRVAHSHGPAPRHPVEWRGVDEIFREADVVSLHCPLGADRAKVVEPARLATMKPTALLLNTARGALVDEDALAGALRDGTIAGAGIDVVSVEPMRADNPLLRAPNCVITPHLAWGSLAARRRLMATTVENVAAFLAGTPINRVA